MFARYVQRPMLFAINKAARYPGIFVSVQSVILFIVIIAGLVGFPMIVDTDFESFLKTDVQSSMKREAFWAAERARPKLLHRRLQVDPRKEIPPPAPPAPVVYAYSVMDMYVAYELVPGHRVDSLLRERALADISDFERRLRALPAYKELCAGSGEEERIYCDPGITMPGYVLPTMVLDKNGQRPNSMRLDGKGWDPLPMETTMWLLKHHKFESLILPRGFEIDPEEGNAPKISVLRSAFRFRIPAGDVKLTNAQRAGAREDAKAKWEKFAREELFPFLNEESPSQIFNVYYDGTGFKELSITEALVSDMMLLIGSGLLVAAYVVFHTRSLLLTALGIIICLASVPLAYIACVILTGTNIVNFTAFLAVFLAVGFGCDVIFVYTDFWVESSKKYDDYTDRLVWTYARAGRASFVTTATTALSFFANLASVIRALRQFGFFMGLCVMLAWVLISLIFVPLCVFDERIQVFRLCGGELARMGKRRQAMLKRWTEVLQRWRRTFVIIPFICILGGLVLSVLMVKQGEGVPKLFPKEHNRVKGQEIMRSFESIKLTAFNSPSLRVPKKVSICSETNFGADTDECSMFWCEVTRANTGKALKETTCACQRQYKPACGADALVTVAVRLLGSGNMAKRLDDFSLDDQLTFQKYVKGPGARGLNYSDGLYSSRRLPSVVQHEWESGRVVQWEMVELVALLDRYDNVSGSCGWKEMCSCGVTSPCSPVGKWDPSASQLAFEEWVPSARGGRSLQPNTFRGHASKSRSGRLLQSKKRGGNYVKSRSDRLLLSKRLGGNYLKSRIDRLLQARTFQWKVKAQKRIKVRVAFGLKINLNFQMLGERADSSMWKYSKSFEVRMPWTQRNLYQFCLALDGNKKLRVTRQWCWFENFRKFLHDRQERFPVQSFRFDALALEFIKREGSTTPGNKYVWLVDGVLKGLYTSHEVDFSNDAPSAEMMKQKALWDDKLRNWNQAAVATARGDEAFHVSSAWAEAEANQELITSAVLTLVILLCLAFTFMVLFTWSIALSLFVVGATLAAIGGLTFFIVIVMRWEVGLIEVIAIVYFIGYAVTYSLHIAHKYACDEEGHESEGLPSSAAVGITDGAGGSPVGAGVGPLDFGTPDRDESSAVRYQRTRFAIASMGAATLGSSATTAGSALFLCFATLTIFQRLGTMCLTVALVSIVVALGPLPAALMIFGPVRPGVGGLRCMKSFCTCGRRSTDHNSHGAGGSPGGSGQSPTSSPSSSSASPAPKGVGKYIATSPQGENAVPRRE